MVCTAEKIFELLYQSSVRLWTRFWMEQSIEKRFLNSFNYGPNFEKVIIKGMLTINLIIIVIEMEVTIDKVEAIPDQTMGDEELDLYSNTHEQRVNRLCP